MIHDPIVDELDRLRAEEMARFNFDFEAFFRAVKEDERRSSKPVEAAPDPMPNATALEALASHR